MKRAVDAAIMMCGTDRVGTREYLETWSAEEWERTGGKCHFCESPMIPLCIDWFFCEEKNHHVTVLTCGDCWTLSRTIPYAECKLYARSLKRKERRLCPGELHTHFSERVLSPGQFDDFFDVCRACFTHISRKNKDRNTEQGIESYKRGWQRELQRDQKTGVFIQ